MFENVQLFSRAVGIFCLTAAIAADFFHSITLLLLFFGVAVSYIFVFLISLRKMEIRTLMVGMAVVCVVIATFQTHWPLRTRFKLSKSALQSAVDQGRAGGKLQAPAWYGLFRPNRIRVYGNQNPGAVAFNSSWFEGNFDGIVFALDQPPGNLNYDSYIQLEKNWYFVHGD